MKKSTIVLLGVLAFFLVLILCLGNSFKNSYNKMITGQEGVEKALADLDTMLQRRADLIPNLVNTVKGESSHELEIINSVTSARTKLVNADTVEEMSEANSQLSSSLKMLMLNVTENYPQIATSKAFTDLRDELSGTENRIAVARRDYNGVVQEYNLFIKKFPNNILAGMFGFEKAEYFEADESAQEVPNVSFD
jgi:LemA protein